MKEFQMPALTKYIIDLKNEKHPETNIFEMCDINEDASHDRYTGRHMHKRRT